MTEQSLVAPDFQDYKYGEKCNVPLWLRFWRANPSVSTVRPWVFWIHGGAYCSGQHYQPRPWLVPLFRSLGIHVVSVSYRLAPEASMEDMVEDCLDGLAWCRSHLDLIDGNTYAVGGDSSGGGLATLIAHRLMADLHPPKAVIDVYGVVDLVYQQRIYDRMGPISKPWHGSDGTTEAEIQAIANGRDPAVAVTSTTNLWVLDGLSQSEISGGSERIASGLKRVWGVSDEEWKYNERIRQQWNIKSYVGHARIMVTTMRRYSTPHLLASDNSSTYPPTVFLHGTADTAVPVEETIHMAARLKELGVKVEELYCADTEHGWDSIYTSPEVEGWSEYIEPIGRFVAEHLGIAAWFRLAGGKAAT